MEVPNQRNEKADGATEDSKEPKTNKEDEGSRQLEGSQKGRKQGRRKSDSSTDEDYEEQFVGGVSLGG
jgi:hypothetical protein